MIVWRVSPPKTATPRASCRMGAEIGQPAECRELYNTYKQCHDKWYHGKFLKGEIEPECRDPFEDYKRCVKVRRQGAGR